MKEILIYAVILWVGIFIGFFIRALFGYKDHYTGTIYVTREEEKTLYSLELNDYPDELRFKKEVVFKIDASKFSELSEIDSPA